jgi:hypothetical protein
MSQARDVLIVRLDSAPAELRWAVAELPEGQWQTRPGERDWNAHEITAHTRDIAKQVYLVRVWRILHEDEPELALFDEDAWMAAHYDPAEPMQRILDELDQAHRDMAALLLDRPDADWARTGRHAEQGARTAVWWARQAIAHVWEHAVQVIRVAQALDGGRGP